uniref:Uncharacterized protein n=1 Tax=Romanomermis culicivorax TaxID=13658 RepID=A0A915KCS6_ROMCU
MCVLYKFLTSGHSSDPSTKNGHLACVTQVTIYILSDHKISVASISPDLGDLNAFKTLDFFKFEKTCGKSRVEK